MMAFEEPRDLPELSDEDRKWDQACPQGFVSDYVLSLRGTEIPTKFGIWAALMCASSSVKRDLYVPFYPRKLYPNFYVLFVAPPGIAKKSYAIEYASEIVENMPKYYPGSDAEKWLRSVNFQKGKITPEGMNDKLKPREHVFKSGTKAVPLTKGSELALWVSELGTAMGRQKYMEGLIPKLTLLYDGQNESTEYTKGAKDEVIEKPYVTFFGGTTPSDLNDVIPPGAFGGGLMSRTLVVYARYPTRMFAMPQQFEGIPSQADLTQRLSYLLKHNLGEFEFSPVAYKYYERWYERYKHFQSDPETNDEQQLMYSRMDVQLLKLSLLVSFQRYDCNKIITLDDIQVAKELLELTLGGQSTAFSEGESGNYSDLFKKIQKHIMYGNGMSNMPNYEITRVALSRRLSKYAPVHKIHEILESMHLSDLIEVYRDGEKQRGPTNRGNEVYRWKHGVSNPNQRDHWDM